MTARSVGQQQNKDKYVESEEPEVASDFVYVHSAGDLTDNSNNLPMLVIKDLKTKMNGAKCVSEKSLGPCAVMCFVLAI